MECEQCGADAPPGRPSGSSRTDALMSDRALESKHAPPAVRREEQSDALNCNRALRPKYEGRRGIAFRRRPGFDALKCNRALEPNYGGRVGFGRLDARFRPSWSLAAGGKARDAVGGSSNLSPLVGRSSSGGFMTYRGLRLGPKEMRIPPLRSAVQMESDVSPGSSVTLGRSERH